MQAIILAAGMGKRLKELTKDKTKCLVKVNGVALIERLLNQITARDISRIIIVVGYKAEELKAYINSLEIKTPVEYIENPIYDTTNNIYSLYLAGEKLCEDDTLLFESDLIFEDKVVDILLEDKRDTLALVDKYQSWMDGTCVKMSEDGFITSIISKKDFRIEESDTYNKTVNIYKFGKGFSQNYYFPFLKTYMEVWGRNNYYEQVLKLLVISGDSGIRAKSLCGKVKWYEIDNADDLAAAESMFGSNEDYLKSLQEKYNELLEKQVRLDLLELAKTKPKLNHRIKVGFLCQDPGLWGNVEPIFKAMLKKDDFEPVLIVIPPIDFKSMNLYLDYDTNYFVNNYPNALRAYNENLELLDLKALDFDYLFYPRPYDGYIPEEYRSNNTVKYVKNCYVPYGYCGTENTLSLHTDPIFFRNIYFLFMESEFTRDMMFNARGETAQKGLQKIMNLGYPPLEPFLRKTSRNEIKSILWTPRWSYDENYGGSHFLEYREMLFELKKQYPQMEIIFRPHPLLFDEMEKQGFMTKEEMEDYLNGLKNEGIIVDRGTPFEEALDRGDLLITDYSSIMIQWILCDKPLIYCPSQIRLYGFFSEIEENSYVADSKEEILNYVERIVAGDDEKKKGREILVSKAKKEHLGATERIVEAIRVDYYKKF